MKTIEDEFRFQQMMDLISQLLPPNCFEGKYEHQILNAETILKDVRRSMTKDSNEHYRKLK